MANSLVSIPSLDWKQFEESLFLNPKLPPSEVKILKELYARRPKQNDHVWLASSGVSAEFKLIALSRTALLNSAIAVNQEIEASSGDCWLLCLPTFHVGGLGILARSYLSGSQVEVLAQWDAFAFAKLCSLFQITLCSLVPSQLRDLVHNGIASPSSLRFIFVGGGALETGLKARALELGYPVYETYGMTETCSQIACENTARQGMLGLKIWELEKTTDSLLKVSGSALCSVVFSENSTIYPLKNGFYYTQDRVNLEAANNGKTRVTPLGRSIEFAKIKGENVNLLRLQQILESLLGKFATIKDAALMFDKNSSDNEEQIKLLYSLNASEDESLELLLEFNRNVLPFERASHVLKTNIVKRSALGKIIYRK